ncbi:MAG: hypothetical protein RR482_08510, partial [Clostridia bacterium]
MEEEPYMALRKCPRCELNYILDGEKYCTVCRREIKGEQEHDAFELCSVCNENPALPGRDMCIFCLKEMGRGEEQNDDTVAADENALELGTVSTMEEIAMDMESDIPPRELGEIDRELSLDEALEEEEEVAKKDETSPEEEN